MKYVTSLEEAAWVDVEHKRYKMENIDDEYLLNILYFVEKGKGHCYFLNKEKITNLFNEAKRRRLDFDCDVSVAIRNFNKKCDTVKSLLGLRWDGYLNEEREW